MALFSLTTAALLAGAGIFGSSIYSATQSGKKTSAPSLPKAPSVGASETAAKEAVKRRRLAMARNETIYTSPLGISGESAMAKKTLLGQ